MGSQREVFAKQRAFVVVILPEARVRKDDTDGIPQLRADSHYKAVRASATRGARIQHAGGIATGIHRRLRPNSFRHLAKFPDQLRGLRADGLADSPLVAVDDFAAAQVRSKCQTLTVIGV